MLSPPKIYQEKEPFPQSVISRAVAHKLQKSQRLCDSLPLTFLLRHWKDWNHPGLKLTDQLFLPQTQTSSSCKNGPRSSADSASSAELLLTSICLPLPRCSTSQGAEQAGQRLTDLLPMCVGQQPRDCTLQAGHRSTFHVETWGRMRQLFQLNNSSIDVLLLFAFFLLESFSFFQFFN